MPTPVSIINYTFPSDFSYECLLNFFVLVVTFHILPCR